MTKLPRLLLLCALGGLLAAATPAPGHGIDLAVMDKKVSPGDDFFAYANGTWLKATPIPDDKSSWGVGQELAEKARKHTVELIQQAAADGGTEDARKVGDTYAAFMDEAAIEAKGLAPLKPRLDAVAGIADRRALSRAMGATLRTDTDPLNSGWIHTQHLLGLWVAQGLDDPDHNVPYLLQGGLGMPDREYYLSDAPKMAELRKKYQAHVAAMLKLAGIKDFDGKAAAVMALEKKIATLHATRLDSENVHLAASWKREELATKAPGLDWAAFLESAGLQRQARFFLWQPKAITALSALVAAEPLDAWKAWLTFHAIEEVADVLPKAFVDEDFAFHDRAMLGTPQIEERWKRGVDATDGALGEVVGKLYAARYFPPEAKAKAQAMVDEILRAFSKRIDGLDWMSAATKAKAKEKVATLKVGVGYPDQWRDYSALKVDRTDAFGNAERAHLFEYRRNLSKLGNAPDRGEWWMVPQEVNAINLPLQNALNFPAAILQPPFFDPQAEPAYNFGATGATIGHEVSHSFDDMGSQFDARGKLDNWWTPDDLKHFQAAGEKLALQYDAYKPFPDVHLDGHQTLGENIADVAGLAVAFDAWKASLKGKPAKALQGQSPEQQFFLSYAQSWSEKAREEALRQQVVTDSHAPASYRCFTVRNLDAWYTAFGVKPGQKLYLAPAARVRVW